MYNKRQYQKYNDKKILHKVKKQWITISLALFMMLGGGAVATHANVSANSSNNQNKPRVSVKAKSNHINTSHKITAQANRLHQNLLNKAVHSKQNIKSNYKKLINTNNKGNIVTVNNKPVKHISNVNYLKLNQSGIFKKQIYNRFNMPFNKVLLNHTTRLHKAINFSDTRSYGAIKRGNIVKISKAFKDYGHYGNYLRYEIPLANKHYAFITGDYHNISYIAPTTNYRYYQHKINYILNHSNNIKFNKIKKSINKLAKHENKNYHKYMNLYIEAYNTQQTLHHPIVVDYNNKNNHKRNITSTKDQNTINSLENNNSVNSIATSSEASFIPAQVSVTNINPISTPIIPVVIQSNSSNNIIPISSSSNNSVISSASNTSKSANTSASISNSTSASSATNSNNAESSTSSISNSVSSSTQSTASSATISNGSNKSTSHNNSSASSSTSNNSNRSISNSTSSSASSSSNHPNKARSISNSTSSNSANYTVKSSNYDGLNYKYTSDNNNKNLEFINGVMNKKNQGNSLVFGDNIPSDIAEANTINFDDGVDTSSISDMSNLFANDANLRFINFGSNFNTNNVTSMKGMFRSDANLISVTFNSLPQNRIQSHTHGAGISFNTSKVSTMSNMFDNDSDLHSVILSPNFDTTHVTDMKKMFGHDISLRKLDIKSPKTIFNNSAFSDNNENWLDGSNNSVNLTDGKSHIGTIINQNANQDYANNIDLNQIKNNIQAAMNLPEGTAYNQLSNLLVNAASANWPQDLTMPISDYLVSTEDGKNINSDMSDATYDEAIVKQDKKQAGIDWPGPKVYFSIFSDTGISDFHLNSISGGYTSTSDDTPVKSDNGYTDVHTFIHYSQPVNVSGMSQSDITQTLLNDLNASDLKSDISSYKLPNPQIGIGITEKHGKVRAILTIGPNPQTVEKEQKGSTNSDAFVKVINHINGVSPDVLGLRDLSNNYFHSDVMSLRSDLENHKNGTSPKTDYYHKYGFDSDTRKLFSDADNALDIASLVTTLIPGVNVVTKFATMIGGFLSGLASGYSGTTISHKSHGYSLMYGNNLENMFSSILSLGDPTDDTLKALDSHLVKEVWLKSLDKAADFMKGRIANRIDAFVVNKLFTIAEGIITNSKYSFDKSNYYAIPYESDNSAANDISHNEPI